VPAQGALPFAGKEGEEGLRQGELKDGVAQKLQPLVVDREVRPVLDAGRMRERLLKPGGVPKSIGEARLKRFKRVFLSYSAKDRETGLRRVLLLTLAMLGWAAEQ